MSVISNQGPFKKSKQSHSQNSLYTDKSDDSEQNLQNINNRPASKVLKQSSKLISSQQKVTPIKETSNKLPEIKITSTSGRGETVINSFNNSFVNDSEERHAMFNQQIQLASIEEKTPKMPQFVPKSSQQQRFSAESRDGILRGKSNKRYFDGYEEEQQGKSFQIRENYQPNFVTPNEVNDDRALRSSQGGKWMRSQSLTNPKEHKTIKFIIRHYHKHNSIMFEALNKFLHYFQDCQQNMQTKIYKISLFDSLDTIKWKMESFLEKKVNLQNISLERPDGDWTQDKLTKFYTQYKHVLIKKETLKAQYHQPITLKKYKNCVFFGLMSDGKKQDGLLHYFNGKFFQGKFKEDQKYEGIQIDEKQLYLGDFKKGLRHGEGILKTSELLFVGTFNGGQYNYSMQSKDQSQNNSLLGMYNTLPSISQKYSKKGFEITHSSIRFYEGMVNILKNSKGDIFIGNLNENDEKNEQGLQIFTNGDMYIGRYEAGTPQGYGEYYWENGAYYRGQFLSGMRHGRGTWHMINGDQYEGQYMNDKKNGKGVYVWKNGSKYAGNFENDYRHGYGEMYWNDGRVYKGKWLNGIQKNTIIKLEHHPKLGNPNFKPNAFKTAFKTIQYGNTPNRKNIPLEKLKSIYNPTNSIN